MNPTWNCVSERLPVLNTIPRIALTPGEPAGIGPDLCVSIARQPWEAELVAVCDPRILQERARLLDIPLQVEILDPATTPRPHQPGRLLVLPVEAPGTVHAGQLNIDNAPYVLETLRLATGGCGSDLFDALVTGPVHKETINQAGVDFTGHTEYLAALTETPRVVMMLATPGLRVALVTTHLPLRNVFAAITPRSVEETLRITHQALRELFAIAHPRILVCGLNPHAGEGGHLGHEETEIITPVIQSLAREGLDIQGPLPADTLFIGKYLDQADAVVAMYHDQGLPVLKHMGFGRAINITLGLPFLRTSVDHGTALELAGRREADTGSMTCAVQTAVEILARRSLPAGQA
ncbi:MAG TPA: 4-hydroxythreonine-4-phosphate dehydrogenase PdxA [Gammaproteobacteria bacterium]|nr:4-hydroxythreonine-4-phosphate dehydrogenase PdxA [Gammaproteobacteria bacterium]